LFIGFLKNGNRNRAVFFRGDFSDWHLALFPSNVLETLPHIVMLETEEFHGTGGGCGGRMELNPILCAIIMLFPLINFQFTLVPMGHLMALNFS
jgi:hypothetical protein